MARLVFLAVLLAAATYASAEDPKYLNISACGDATCKQCNNQTTADFIAGECQKDATGSYQATCTEGGNWKVELFDGNECGTTTTHTIDSTSGKCYQAANSIAAKVVTIDPLKVKVCALAAEDKCTAATDGVDDCTQYDITATTDCSKRLGGASGYYYTAALVDAPAQPSQGGGQSRAMKQASADKVLTLKLYATQKTCKATQLPVFEGMGMKANDCTNFQQKLNAEACGVPTKAPDTEAPANNSSTDNSSTEEATKKDGGEEATQKKDGGEAGDSSATNNSSDNSTTENTLGGSAVSAVLALLAAACAVWML